MQNRYAGYCLACRTWVEAGEGHFVYHEPERRPNRRRSYGALWCAKCFDEADHASAEDRCCGDAAYEDACAQACGV